VGAADRTDAADRVVGANHAVVVELEASHVDDRVMVEANPENGVIQVPRLIIIVVGRSQECVGDLLQLHLGGNQPDHVTLVDLEVKIEVAIEVAEVVDITEHHQRWHHQQCTATVNLP